MNFEIGIRIVSLMDFVGKNDNVNFLLCIRYKMLLYQ